MRQSTDSEPVYFLVAIARVGALRARELIANGHSIDEAVALACRGPWSQWRWLVHNELCAEALAAIARRD